MELILHHTRIHPETTDGYIMIGDTKVCDTAEHTPFRLHPGVYVLTRKKFYMAHGNGVYTLNAPKIIVGKHRCRGVVTDSYETWVRLYGRLKKAFARQEIVILVVK